jgi:hypothetical protein
MYEVVVALFEILFFFWIRGTQENHKTGKIFYFLKQNQTVLVPNAYQKR